MAIGVTIPVQETIEDYVKYLKEWLLKEPHLPKIKDEKWLERFLYHNKFSLEKTKFKLENYYSLRTKYPEFFKNRDPTAPEMLKCRQWLKIAVSEKLLEVCGTWVVFLKFEADANAFDVIVYTKRVYMIFDMMLLKEPSRMTDLMFIVDFRNFRYLHGLKLLSELAKHTEINNNAYTERIKALHYINVPIFAQKFLELGGKLYKKKLLDRVQIHSTSNSSFLEMVDKEVVCKDFGGSGPTLAQLEEQTQQELEKYRKWFEEQDDVCSDESLRRKDFDQFEEMRGSFRKLEVD